MNNNTRINCFLLRSFAPEKKLSNPKEDRIESEKRVIKRALDGVRIMFNKGILKRRVEKGVNFPIAAIREITVKQPKKNTPRARVSNIFLLRVGRLVFYLN